MEYQKLDALLVIQALEMDIITVAGWMDIEGYRMALVSSLDIHLVQLAAGGCDLLDTELAQLGLELAELLDQIILALVPELTGLDL